MNERDSATTKGTPFRIEPAPVSQDEIPPVLAISTDARADILTSMLGIFHGNLVSWTTRSFEIVTWSVGVNMAVVSFVFLYPEKNTPTASIVVSLGLVGFAAMIQTYLRASARAHYGNRLAIAKCEAALGLYEPGQYLKNRPFFVYSGRMLTSRNLRVLMFFHAGAVVFTILMVMLGGHWT